MVGCRVNSFRLKFVKYRADHDGKPVDPLADGLGECLEIFSHSPRLYAVAIGADKDPKRFAKPRACLDSIGLRINRVSESYDRLGRPHSRSDGLQYVTLGIIL